MPQEWETLSANLSECCFDKVPAGAPLCIVLGGSSAELPIGLINVADQTLLERNPISYLPSLSFLAYLEGESIAQQPRALVIGDSLADLPWARREAKSVAQRFGVTALLGLQAVRFRIAPALGQCSILHVACHATFNYADPERSGFYLADRTLFSVRDAMQLRLSAQLAFLSACESGRAVLKPGDDAIGLSAGLLSAGFKTVISTAWRVPDRATSIIAERFYSELIDHGCEVPEALRRAQLGVASIPKYSHPYFWAAFGVMGDWKNPFVSAVALA
jgi:CHAT domain-containing protein